MFSHRTRVSPPGRRHVTPRSSMTIDHRHERRSTRPTRPPPKKTMATTPIATAAGSPLATSAAPKATNTRHPTAVTGSAHHRGRMTTGSVRTAEGRASMPPDGDSARAGSAARAPSSEEEPTVEAVILCGIQAAGKTSFYRDRYLDTHGFDEVWLVRHDAAGGWRLERSTA